MTQAGRPKAWGQLCLGRDQVLDRAAARRRLWMRTWSMSPECLSCVGWLPEPGGDVGWCDEGFDRDRGDEGGGDRVGADPGIDGQWPEYRGVGAQQDAVEVRRDDVAGDQGQAQAGPGQVERGRALLGAY